MKASNRAWVELRLLHSSCQASHSSRAIQQAWASDVCVVGLTCSSTLHLIPQTGTPQLQEDPCFNNQLNKPNKVGFSCRIDGSRVGTTQHKVLKAAGKRCSRLRPQALRQARILSPAAGSKHRHFFRPLISRKAEGEAGVHLPSLQACPRAGSS